MSAPDNNNYEGRSQQSANIPFTKASAYGNDFLLIEGKYAFGDLSELTRRLCDRHNGVGADGVEWLYADAEVDIRARLINADGSEAEISGNGTRCVAAEISSRTNQAKVAVRTDAGVKLCRLSKRQGSMFEFEAEMGKPELGEQFLLDLPNLRVVGTKVSMGNPHFVIFVEDFPDAWQREAARIGKQTQFPQGVNVIYERVCSEHVIEIRIFERGAGETQSSGTGSCAAAVAAIASKRVASPVKVIAPGGPQTVRWEDQVILQGSANLVCRGEFFT